MLYGKNGAGKTRLLDQLTYAFQGTGEPQMGSKARPLIDISVEVRPAAGDNDLVSALYDMLEVSKELQRDDKHREEFQSALLGRVNAWEDLDDALALIDFPELRTSQGFRHRSCPLGLPRRTLDGLSVGYP